MPATKRHAKTVSLLETVYSTGLKVDRENGVIHGVKVLGRESRNNREYTPKAVADAIKLYEGRAVNVDHPELKERLRERGIMEAFGELRGVQERADGVYADLHFIKSHPATPVIAEMAERFPDKLGLSHNADGKTKPGRGGKLLVESISRVVSVDLVRDPATTNGLFESKETPVPITLREALEKAFPGLADTCGLLEMDGMGAMTVDAPADATGEDYTWSAFRSAIMGALDDDGLDTSATMKKIGVILKAYDKLSAGPKEDKKTETPKEEAAMAESKKTTETQATDPTLTKLLESVERLEKRDLARGIMAEHGVTGEALLESLVKLPDVAAMKELAAKEAGNQAAPFRRTAGVKPLMESATKVDHVTLPSEAKDFASRWR